MKKSLLFWFYITSCFGINFWTEPHDIIFCRIIILTSRNMIFFRIGISFNLTFTRSVCFFIITRIVLERLTIRSTMIASSWGRYSTFLLWSLFLSLTFLLFLLLLCLFFSLTFLPFLLFLSLFLSLTFLLFLLFLSLFLSLTFLLFLLFLSLFLGLTFLLFLLFLSLFVGLFLFSIFFIF